jgi:hypothetical protein
MVHLPGKGIGARRVPLILTPDVLKAMNCLTEFRVQCAGYNGLPQRMAGNGSFGAISKA